MFVPVSQSGFTLSPDHLSTVDTLKDAIRGLHARKVSADDFRSAMDASRTQWGDDVHEVLKATAMSCATGGRA